MKPSRITRRHIFLWLPFILVGISLVTYANIIFISYIRIEPMTQLEANCEETFYSGTGPIDLELGCLKDSQDRDKITDNIYGVLAVDGGGVTQGQYTMAFIPTKGMNYEIGAASGVVYRRGTWINCGVDFWVFRFIGYYPQYQDSKIHLVWPNPDNVNWKLTFYRKGR